MNDVLVFIGLNVIVYCGVFAIVRFVVEDIDATCF